jgi:prevent-host-death family protein
LSRTSDVKDKTVPAGEFKNSCLKLMEQVHRAGVPLVVTKRGKPLVRIVAVREESPALSLLGTIVSEADDITSTGESWEAAK